MPIIVTGATGFIGSYVIEELLRRNFEVYVTARDVEKAKSHKWYSKVVFHPYSIGDQMSILDKNFFAKGQILIHLAWDGLPDFKSEAHTQTYLPKHLYFLKTLHHLGVKRMLITGTCLEYGLQEGELYEETPTLPITSYGIAKNELRLSLEQLDIELVWARLFYMYGKGQNAKSILMQLQKALDENEKQFNMSLGEQERDYLPVEKVAEFLVHLALHPDARGVFNCSSGKPIKIIDLVQNYLSAKNAEIFLNLGYYNYPDYEPFKFWGSNKKILQLT